ncbi:MAG: phosphoribosylglycinamide formyltransferase [Deltaproteobacteria bacterium]|nr:phosphoribosylglycinamide formyltransferase [Deltaproteobacteria bacterium]
MSFKIAILISGRGSNMQAIHRSIQENKLKAHIAVVISNQADAAGLNYAKEHNIPTEVLTHQAHESRESYDQRLASLIQKYFVDLIVLAGFMRILSPSFIQAFPQKIINIHPSLLPAFPGLHVHEQAIAAGVRYSGCTVHYVDEGCDTGPIIDQRVVPVLPEDTADTLAARILKEEHQLYSECIQKIAAGQVKIENNKVILNFNSKNSL